MIITPDRIRAALAATSLQQATASIEFPEDRDRLPPEWLARLDQEMKRAGVLIPLIERVDGLTVLLTQRSAELKHHASQVSFPGGSVEPHDTDLAATALRETHEEVGIAPHEIDVVGYLQTMPTITGYAVTPIVGISVGEPTLTIDRAEVELAFEVPLEFLLDSANDVPVERDFFGTRIVRNEFHWQGQRIWGATASMIEEFRKIILKQ